MASTKEFFKKKKEWSNYKDALLGSYILPYFNKIMSTGVEVVYIDGFAGKSLMISLLKVGIATYAFNIGKSFIYNAIGW